MGGTTGDTVATKASPTANICIPPFSLQRDRKDAYKLRWLTDVGLQRLTQSCCETSSSSTDDDIRGDRGSVDMGVLGPIYCLWYDGLQRAQMRV